MKTVNELVKDKCKKEGYRKICKNCRNKSLILWRSYNRDKLKESSLRYINNNPLKRVDQSKRYYDKIKSIDSFRKSRKEILIRWKRTEKGKIIRRILEEKRRKWARETDDGSITFESVNRLIVDQQNRCAITGESLTNGFHIDHIVPLSKGGKHTIKNIQLTTPIANLRKGDKLDT